MIDKIAYAQTIGILKYIPIKEINKIPESILNEIVEKSESDYSFEFNPEISFEKQGITNEAKEIISILYNIYFSETNENKLNSKLNYNFNDLFNKNNFMTAEKDKDIENKVTSLIIKRESFITKILRKIFKK